MRKKLLKNQETINNNNNINSNISENKNPYSGNLNKENAEEAIAKLELENIDPKLRIIYEPLIAYIGEENLKKLFSSQIVYKEEGLDYLAKTLRQILEKSANKYSSTKSAVKAANISNISKKESGKNSIINILMKLIFLFMKHKHPNISIKTINIFQNLLLIINEFSTSKEFTDLSYDYNVTDRILFKIKEKLGDANLKIRTKAVDLYCLLLRQNLCDYNNLLSELLEDEANDSDNIKVIKSSKTIFGKLSILDNVFDEIQNALADKRTNLNIFPFTQILTYVIENITNSKSEIRKLARRILVKMYTHFGYKAIEPILKKVDDRELIKLLDLVPEVLDTIRNKQLSNIKNQPNNNNISFNNLSNNSLSIINKSLLARKLFDRKKSINSNNNNNISNNNKSFEKKIAFAKASPINADNIRNNNNIYNISNNANDMHIPYSEKDTKNKIKTEEGNKDYTQKTSMINPGNEKTEALKGSTALNKAEKDNQTSNLISGKNNKLICSYCGKSDENFINNKALEDHILNFCVLFFNCPKCAINVEVRLLNQHLVSQCNKKAEVKICKRCKEPIDMLLFNEHLKSNDCNPAKNINSSNRCPLCHLDIPPFDKGFVNHLVNEKCQKQNRKYD